MTIVKVTVSKPYEDAYLGIDFARQGPNYPLTISKIDEDGGLFKKTPLIPGLVVKTIQGKHVTWMSPDEVWEILHDIKCGDLSVAAEGFIGKITRKSSDKLGMVIRESDSKSSTGIIISKIKEGSKFSKTDLKPGMMIVSINGSSCPRLAIDTVKILRSTVGKLKVVAVKANRNASVSSSPHVPQKKSPVKAVAPKISEEPKTEHITTLQKLGKQKEDESEARESDVSQRGASSDAREARERVTEMQHEPKPSPKKRSMRVNLEVTSEMRVGMEQDRSKKSKVLNLSLVRRNKAFKAKKGTAILHSHFFDEVVKAEKEIVDDVTGQATIREKFGVVEVDSENRAATQPVILMPAEEKKEENQTEGAVVEQEEVLDLEQNSPEQGFSEVILDTGISLFLEAAQLVVRPIDFVFGNGTTNEKDTAEEEDASVYSSESDYSEYHEEALLQRMASI